MAITHLHNVCVGPALVRLVVLGVLEQHLVHVGAGVLEQLVGAVEDDQGDLAVAQHAQLVGFLHQAKLTLGERHLRRRRRRRGRKRSRQQRRRASQKNNGESEEGGTHEGNAKPKRSLSLSACRSACVAMAEGMEEAGWEIASVIAYMT